MLGARTERYPDLLDICCAITGRAPAVGLHLTENRAGQVLFRLVDVPAAVQADDTFYPVLGHLLGQVCGDRIPVVDGLVVTPDEDQLKALGAAAASSGAVALFHIVGVTPEAPTLDAAMQGRQPQQVVDVDMATLRRARAELTTADGDRLDMVVLGSPHFSLAEFRQLAPLLAGQRVHPAVQFLVTSSRGMALLARQAGYLPGAGTVRRQADRGHLHPGHAHVAAAGQAADDQLGQVRLLCARYAQHACHLRQPGRLCAFGRGRPGAARGGVVR